MFLQPRNQCGLDLARQGATVELPDGPEVKVAIDADRLRHTGLSTDDVIRRLAEENINVAGGTLREGRTEYMVRTLNEYTNLTQIGDTIVAFTDGRQVRIRDLGEVVWANAERQITTRTNGLESVQIEVFKEADANIVAMASAVREALEGRPAREIKRLILTASGGPFRTLPAEPHLLFFHRRCSYQNRF